MGYQYDRFERLRALRVARRLTRSNIELLGRRTYQSAIFAFWCTVFTLPAYTNPNGGQIVGGEGTISAAGDTLTINQTSDKLIINWDDFSIGEGEVTRFNQPGSDAIALNRIVGQDPSVILGQLTADGRLILINPNGILFGKGSRVDVGGLIATTHDIDDADFLSGNYVFDQSGNSDASVVNEGTITAADTGLVAFVAPSVRNSGLIAAKLGRVELGAATKFTLDFYGDSLISFPVDAEVMGTIVGPDGEPVGALVTMDGNIEAATVILSARAARGIVSDVISTGGTIKATNAREEGGRIILDGGANGTVSVNGILDASGIAGGTIALSGERVMADGAINATGQNEVTLTSIVNRTSGFPYQRGLDARDYEPIVLEVTVAGGSGGDINIDGEKWVSVGGDIDASGRSGGTVIVEAGGLSHAGTIRAMGEDGVGGRVTIYSKGTAQAYSVAGIDVSGASGGTIRQTADTQITTSGTYLALGLKGDGGNIDMSAPVTKLLSPTFATSGLTSGGQIRIGGEFQGGKDLETDELSNADTLIATDGTKIYAHTLGSSGDGGTVILWSDEQTIFLGSITATPGAHEGEGGFVEISSKGDLTYNGSVTTGIGDRNGTVLLDPKNITIVDDTFSQLQLILGYNYSSGPGELRDPLLDANDYLGSAVSLDGTNLAVGAFSDDGVGNALVDPGAVHLFQFSDTSFNGGALVATLGHGYTGGKNIDLSSVLDANDRFGVSVSLDGTRLAVGAFSDDGAGNASGHSGAVHLFQFSDTGFSGGALVATLGHGYTGGKNIDLSSVLDANDFFGVSVSLNGTTLAVGAREDGGAGNALLNSGAVYLFQFSDASFNGGTLSATLGHGYTGGKNVDLSGVLDVGDRFGVSVSLDGTNLAVGAYSDDGATNAMAVAGAVHLFQFSDTSFNGGALVATLGHGYTGGKNIDLSSILDASDIFGYSVSLDGTTLVVGAVGDDGAGNGVMSSGAVHLFKFSDTSFNGGSLEVTLGQGYAGGKNVDLSGVLDASDSFGTSVSLDGTRLAVGATHDDGAGNTLDGSGAVHLFSFDDTSFSGGKHVGSIGDGYEGSSFIGLDLNGAISLDAVDQFGSSVALDGTRLAVGATGDDGAGNAMSYSGAVHLFQFSDTSFNGGTLEATLGHGYTGGKNVDLTGVLDVGDYFGSSVSLDGTRLAVGARGDDGNTNSVFNVGAVYLFTFADMNFGGGALEAIIGLDYIGPKDLDMRSIGGMYQNGFFGTSISLDGTRLAVGSTYLAGTVFLFDFLDTSFSGGSLEAKIGVGYSGTNDLDLVGVIESGDSFGSALSLDGTRLAVGAAGDDGDGVGSNLNNYGAIYLFSFSDEAFSSGLLEATMGHSYTGGKNVDLSGNLDTSDTFGGSLSLDGNQLAVGASGDSGNTNSVGQSGAVYLFSFVDMNFGGGTIEAIIGHGYTGAKNVDLSGKLEASDRFGSSVSLDGTNLAVGAAKDKGSGNTHIQSGAVHLFQFTDTAFNGGQFVGSIGVGYQNVIDASQDLNAANLVLGSGDTFGYSVSLDGTSLAVGARRDDGLAGSVTDAGAVHLFTFTDTDFGGATLEGTIGVGYTGGKNVDLTGYLDTDLFGSSVSLDGSRLAVGAPWDSGAGNTVSRSGAVYLFSFADMAFSGGALEARIGYGYTGAKDINLASYLSVNDILGNGVSLEGTNLAIGVHLDDGSGNSLTDSGAVYLFSFTDLAFNGGTLEGRVGHGYGGAKDVNMAGVLLSGDQFGVSVDLDGANLVAGAYRDSGGGLTTSGAAYLFSFTDTSYNGGVLQASIGSGFSGGKNLNLSGPLDSGDQFGYSVSLEGTNLVVGAYGDDGFSGGQGGSGAVYLFTFSDTSFNGVSHTGTMGYGYSGSGDTDMSAWIGASDNFGYSLSLDAGRLAAGSPGDDGTGNAMADSGAVYLFNLGTALAGTIGGSSYTNDPSTSYTLAGSSLTALLDGGNNVILQASNDITLGVDLVVNNGVGDGGDLTLQAGRSILINNNITTDNGSLTLIANDTAAGGVVDAYRDAGAAVITMAPGTSIDAGTSVVSFKLSTGFGNTNTASGDVTLGTISGGIIVVANNGPDNGDVVLNGALTASGSIGDANNTAIVVAATGGNFINNGGASALDPGAGRFIVYSQNPSSDTSGGLSATPWYNTVFNPAAPTAVSGTGNRFAYNQTANLQILSDAKSREYGEANPALTGTITGYVNGETSSILTGTLGFVTSATLSSDVGTYAINDTGLIGTDRNYTISPAADLLTITPATLTVDADDKSRDYGDANPSLTGQISGFKLTDTSAVVSGLGYSTGASQSSNIGTYAITGSGASATNYVFSYIGGTLTVDAATLTIEADDKSRDYGDASPSLTGQISGFKLSDTAAVISGLGYATGASQSSNIGTYAITGSGASAANYVFSYTSGTLTVDAATLTVEADDKSRDYGDANPALTGQISGFKLSDTSAVVSGLSYATGASQSSNVGAYAITGSGASATNYVFSYIGGTLTVDAATLTIETDDKSRDYGDANPSLTGQISGFKLSDTSAVISGLGYATGATQSSNVGAYTITGSGASATNYVFSYTSGILTVDAATLTVEADDKSRDYGDANPALTGQISGFKLSDTAAVVSGLGYGTAAAQSSNVGTYAITGSGASATNYVFSYIGGTLTVDAATLTIEAGDKSRDYGDANPALTGQITGFKLSDTSAVISGFGYTTSASQSSNVGTYAITGSGASATNYVFSYTSGTLTVDPATLTIEADDKSREFGDANPALTGQISGFRLSDTAAVVSGLVYSTSATQTSSVGPYVITSSGGSATNYIIVTRVGGVLTIEEESEPEEGLDIDVPEVDQVLGETGQATPEGNNGSGSETTQSEEQDENNDEDDIGETIERLLCVFGLSSQDCDNHTS